MPQNLRTLVAMCLFLALSLANVCCPRLILAQQPVAAPSANAAPKDDNPLNKLPKIVATVGGQTITRERLGQECVKRYGTIVLDNFLNKHLILQACRAKGIVITTDQVNQEIARMASSYGLTPALFLKTFEENRDFPPERYASEIVWPMLALRALAADKIQVTREEVQKIFASEYGPKVQVRMIAVQDRAVAEQLHAQVTAAPETFRRVAKEKSIDAASASVEGMLPPIRQNSGDDMLERMAFQLQQPNQISPIFNAAELHIILQLVRHLPANPPSAQYIPVIEQRIADQLQQDRLIKASDEIFKELQKGSQVVQVIGNPELEKAHPNIAGLINGQPVPLDQLAGECVSRHGKEILKGEINRLVIGNALKQRNIGITQADIDVEIARAADALGYIKKDGTPDVDGWLKSVMQEEGATLDLYISDAVWPSVALKKLVADKIKVTEEDLQKGFESNFGPRAEVLAIVLSNQRIAEQVWSEARANMTEANFGELAAKYSVEPVSRSNYGKVPPIRRHSGQPTLEKAAFDINPGELSHVIAVGEQFVIMFKQGMTTPVAQNDAAIRAELTREITEKKLRIEMQNELDRLLAAGDINNFLDEKLVPAKSQVQAASANINVPLPAAAANPNAAQAASQAGGQATRPAGAPSRQAFGGRPAPVK
ncbi:MAG: peptidylprolyl isomerase [Pirellulaceae bacterium]|nr:peptidylprolyl isomerase [Pirellulaceae bacterium]